MLRKEFRLPARQKLKDASFYKASNFTLRIAANNLPNSRFGFIVKKTTDKRATARNRARRVFRSCIEEIMSNISPGWDMLFSLEKGIIGKPRKEVCEVISTLLSQKGYMK